MSVRRYKTVCEFPGWNKGYAENWTESEVKEMIKFSLAKFDRIGVPLQVYLSRVFALNVAIETYGGDTPAELTEMILSSLETCGRLL